MRLSFGPPCVKTIRLPLEVLLNRAVRFSRCVPRSFLIRMDLSVSTAILPRSSYDNYQCRFGQIEWRRIQYDSAPRSAAAACFKKSLTTSSAVLLLWRLRAVHTLPSASMGTRRLNAKRFPSETMPCCQPWFAAYRRPRQRCPYR